MFSQLAVLVVVMAPVLHLRDETLDYNIEIPTEKLPSAEKSPKMYLSCGRARRAGFGMDKNVIYLSIGGICPKLIQTF